MIKVNGMIYSHLNNRVGPGLHMGIARVGSSIIKLKSFITAQHRKDMAAALSKPLFCHVFGADDQDTTLLRTTLGHSLEKLYSINKISTANSVLSKQKKGPAVICLLVNCETDDCEAKLTKIKAWIDQLLVKYDLPVFLFVGVPNAQVPSKIAHNFIEPLLDYSQVTHIYNRRLVAKRIVSARHLTTELIALVDESDQGYVEDNQND